MLFLLLTLGVAVAGGLLAMRLKIPAGAMIGSMFAVALLNIVTGEVHLAPQVKVLTQAMAGAFIGVGMTRDTLKQLRSLVLPALFLMVWMQAQGILMGFLVQYISHIDLITALLSTAPGGIVEMSLISMDMNADTSTVALLHTVRLSAVILCFPPMVKPLVARFGHLSGKPSDSGQPAQKQDTHAAWKELPLPARLRIQTVACTPTILIGIAGAVVGYLLRIPAGALLFSIIATSCYSLVTHKAWLPMPVRRCAQMVAGALIGQGLGMEELRRAGSLIVPALVIVIGYLICNVILGVLLAKLFKVDLATGLLASSPAGASDMALLAPELGAQGSSVAVLHIVRLVSVIAIYPQLVNLLT